MIGGYSDGTFRPADPINFVEAAKIIAVADTVGYGPPDLPPETTVWYERFVQYLEQRRAVPSSIAVFDQPLSRGEMAEIIWRLRTTAAVDIESELSRMLLQTAARGSLNVYYTDMHGLWGGEELVATSDGRVAQTLIRTQRPPALNMTEQEVTGLIRLLLNQKAWRQDEPERPSQPDESTARLRIEAGGSSSEIWVWFNDLDSNDRIGRIATYIRGEIR